MNTKLLLARSFAIVLLLLLGARSRAQPTGNNTEKINYAHFFVSCTDDKKVIVDWDVDTLPEANYFELEKSTDGRNFKTIALILGPNPGRSLPVFYSCYDNKKRKAKLTYYRVKHVSSSGREDLSEVKTVAKNQ